MPSRNEFGKWDPACLPRDLLDSIFMGSEEREGNGVNKGMGVWVSLGCQVRKVGSGVATRPGNRDR